MNQPCRLEIPHDKAYNSLLDYFALPSSLSSLGSTMFPCPSRCCFFSFTHWGEGRGNVVWFTQHALGRTHFSRRLMICLKHCEWPALSQSACYMETDWWCFRHKYAHHTHTHTQTLTLMRTYAKVHELIEKEHNHPSPYNRLTDSGQGTHRGK